MLHLVFQDATLQQDIRESSEAPACCSRILRTVKNVQVRGLPRMIRYLTEAITALIILVNPNVKDSTTRRLARWRRRILLGTKTSSHWGKEIQQLQATINILTKIEVKGWCI